MKCLKCDKIVADDAMFCRYCGGKIQKNRNSDEEQIVSLKSRKKNKKWIIGGCIVLIFLIYILLIKCKSMFCLLPAFGGEYCSIHTCNLRNCTNKVAEGKNYCYTHSPSSSSTINYTPEQAEDVLLFSNIEVTKNSLYNVCTATITNNGKKTYTFVEVKGKFKDSSGSVIDTDWTYAVGSEGLAPGESTTFRLSVDKNSNITKCELEILDYEK